MESLNVHDLTAAYALNALDADEAREYEQHLARCERCQRELAELGGAATALAYAVDAPVPPGALRERILATARRERENVVPLRPRWTTAAKAVTAVAACLAVAFGVWAALLSRSLSSTRDARDEARSALAILSDPNARRIAFENGRGAVVVDDSGAAVLTAAVAPAPSGKTYEAWVIQDGRPLRAGTFDGGGTSVVRLSRDVPDGARVAVTVERDGGVDAPQGRMVLQSQPV